MKLLLANPQTRAACERTVTTWNQAVRAIELVMLAMRRGDRGEAGLKFWAYVCAGSNKWHSLYLLTEPIAPTPRPSKSGRAEWEVAAPVVKQFGVQQSLADVRRKLPHNMWKEAIQQAVARIKSVEELTKVWHDEHKVWLEEKSKWEQDHAAYMAQRPLIDAFHQTAGITSGRWGRWALWLEFLQQPGIVQWKDPDAVLTPLTADELAAANRSRRRSVERQKATLFKKNPQLEEFDRLHRIYEREYARTGRRRNMDGFRHPPTMTLPHFPGRADWPRFQQGYGGDRLDLTRRQLRLRAVSDNPEAPLWLTLEFVPDPRLLGLVKLEEAIKVGKTLYEYQWHDGCGGEFLAHPSGIKLIERNGNYFASISVVLHRVGDTFPLTQAHATTYSPAWTLKKLREVNSSPITTCAIDLAIRHLGAVSVAVDGNIIARRIIHNRFSLPEYGDSRPINIPTLAMLSEAKRALGRARRKIGGTRRGDMTAGKLRDRYQHLQDDRTKKAVAALFAYARYHGAKVVIFENLQTLRTSAAFDRAINRALQAWNRGAILKMAQQLAEDAGLRVVTVRAWWTSKICARCDSLGVRYNQGGRTAEGPLPRNSAKLNRLGKWFYCPSCQHRIHADLNASENLHRVFLETFPKTSSSTGGCIINGVATLYADVEAAAQEAGIS